MRIGHLHLAAGCMAAVVLAANGSAAAQKTLTYASHLPATHWLHAAGLQPMFANIERATGGSLRFELLPNGAMGHSRAMLSVVRERTVDAAVIDGAYTKSELPAAAAISDLFILADHGMAMTGAVNEMQLLQCPECDGERERVGIKALAFVSSPAYLLMCARPVAGLPGLSGLNVQATGPAAGWIRAAGATPVGGAAAEVYQSMQRGRLDCVLGPPSWLDTRDLKQFVTSVVQQPMGADFGMMAYGMNRRSWDDLSDAERTAIVDALPGLVRRIAADRQMASDAAVLAGLENALQLSPPDDAMTELLSHHRQRELARAAAIASDAGVENAEQMLKTFAGLIAKWQGIVQGIGGDPDRFEAALRSEIFAKLQ